MKTDLPRRRHRVSQQVSVEEIQKLNPQLDQQLRIYPGDKLTIKAEKPVLDVVIVYENTVTQARQCDIIII